MATKCVILMGGLLGADGYVDSEGMEYLGKMLVDQGVIAKENLSIFTFMHYQDEAESWISGHVAAHSTSDKLVLIGYSGGGSRGTYLTRAMGNYQFDLFVAYDPSPKWQMLPVGPNVKNVLLYYNSDPKLYVPFLGSLGGGVITAVDQTRTHIETVTIAQEHLLVQENSTLHARTIAAIKALGH